MPDRRPGIRCCRHSPPSFRYDRTHGARPPEPTSAHSHAHVPLDYGRAFAIGITLNLVYVVGEAVAGVISGSLALIADAGHNLSDVLALALSWGAAVFSRRRPSDRFTYGLRSSSILAAFANAMILLVVTGGIAWEAVERIANRSRLPAQLSFGWPRAAFWSTGRPHSSSPPEASGPQFKSAFLHMAADALVTAGVVVAGIAIALTGWFWLDPAVSLVVSAVIVIGTWGLVKSAIGLALDAVPEGVDAAAVRAHLRLRPASPGCTICTSGA